MQINKNGLETNKIILASTATKDRFDKVYILLNSIKQTKQPETKIEYWLFVKGEEIDACVKTLAPISSSADFTIIYQNIDSLASAVHTPARDHIYYAKCLFPVLFKQYTKLLYLDVDMVFYQKGIEDLWNTDITDYYLGACIDPTWQYCPNYRFDVDNTKTKNYFNAGMMLFNLERIREEGKAEELQHWCLHWNLNELACNCFDQTLLNYILRDKVKILDFKYNNSLLSCLGIAKNAYAQYLKEVGYDNPKDSLYDAVILHFCGANKPWHTNVNGSAFPCYLLASSIWDELAEKYRKQKIKIIQYFVGNNEKYLELTHETEALNKKYAELYNYDYEFKYFDESVITNHFGVCTKREIMAYKMKYIYDNLIQNDYDIIVFLDADAAVSKPTITIESLLDDEHDLYVCRGNDIQFQIDAVNTVYNEFNRLFSNAPNRLVNEVWFELLKKENGNGLYGALDTLASSSYLQNEGFYIVKNTEKMKELFKDIMTAELLLQDCCYSSKVELDGRAISLCLLKKKYNSSFTYLYPQAQGAHMGGFHFKYNVNNTFILHEYGSATTLDQKIYVVKALWYNKWWKSCLI